MFFLLWFQVDVSASRQTPEAKRQRQRRTGGSRLPAGRRADCGLSDSFSSLARRIAGPQAQKAGGGSRTRTGNGKTGYGCGGVKPAGESGKKAGRKSAESAAAPARFRAMGKTRTAEWWRRRISEEERWPVRATPGSLPKIAECITVPEGEGLPARRFKPFPPSL